MTKQTTNVVIDSLRVKITSAQCQDNSKSHQLDPAGPPDIMKPNCFFFFCFFFFYGGWFMPFHPFVSPPSYVFVLACVCVRAAVRVLHVNIILEFIQVQSTLIISKCKGPDVLD